MKGILTILIALVVILGIGVLVGWVFNNALVGFFTVGGLIVLWALWGAIKELWAWITKAGVHEKDNKEK
jgi:divalent metal cation (Fe/Co/Zn/Cd) transporter